MGRTPAGSASPSGIRSNRRFSTTRSRRPSGSSSLKRLNQGCWRASRRQDVLQHARALALARGPRRTGSAAPDQRHITPKVWQTREQGRVLVFAGSRRTGGRPGASQDGSSWMPWLPFRDAVVLPGVEMARTAGPQVEREAAAGRLRAPPRAAARRRRARARGGRSPGSGSSRSQPVSRTAWTSESWPRFGQPWFMSSTARRRPAGRGRARPRAARPGRTRRRRRGRWRDSPLTQNCRPFRTLYWQERGICRQSSVRRARPSTETDVRTGCREQSPGVDGRGAPRRAEGRVVDRTEVLAAREMREGPSGPDGRVRAQTTESCSGTMAGVVSVS